MYFKKGIFGKNKTKKRKLPSFWGNMDSSSNCDSIQSIKYSTYFGADTSIGFLICTPSAHLYSYLKVSIYIIFLIFYKYQKILSCKLSTIIKTQNQYALNGHLYLLNMLNSKFSNQFNHQINYAIYVFRHFFKNGPYGFQKYQV